MALKINKTAFGGNTEYGAELILDPYKVNIESEGDIDGENPTFYLCAGKYEGSHWTRHTSELTNVQREGIPTLDIAIENAKQCLLTMIEHDTYSLQQLRTAVLLHGKEDEIEALQP